MPAPRMTPWISMVRTISIHNSHSCFWAIMHPQLLQPLLPAFRIVSGRNTRQWMGVGSLKGEEGEWKLGIGKHRNPQPDKE